jgi:Radical SAM superfamily
VVGESARPKRRFQLVLIKPSHYDDDGYVIQWARAFVPSNTLAVLYSLGRDCAQRAVLGTDVAIDITVIDEIHTRVKIGQLLSRFRRHGGFGLVGVVGVQSNQYPRALDIARTFRAAGVPVIIGGFHVSGCLAMLPEMPANLKAALDMGVSLFAGELEGRMDGILLDAANGALQPVYNFLKDLPALESGPTPILPVEHLKKTFQALATFDAGRGCPYQCSFCTIINIQGKKSRGRSADDVERIIREHYAQGIRHFFITDDNLARNKDWEAIFDRIIALAGTRKDEHSIDGPSRYAVSQDSKLHRESRPRRHESGAGRSRKHQPCEPAHGEEASEQDYRIPQDAARLEERGGDHNRRVHPRISLRHARIHPPGYRDHTKGAAPRYS